MNVGSTDRGHNSFDPYYRWLGIPPAEQPATLYRLLGLSLFEPDSAVIEEAADRQMAHVRTHQTGKHSAASQKLLNELSTAKLTLMDAAKKSEYDEYLKLKSSAAKPPLPPPVAKAAAIKPPIIARTPTAPQSASAAVAPQIPAAPWPRHLAAIPQALPLQSQSLQQPTTKPPIIQPPPEPRRPKR